MITKYYLLETLELCQILQLAFQKLWLDQPDTWNVPESIEETTASHTAELLILKTAVMNYGV